MKTVVGDNCYIMINSHIAHDCVIGNNVTMANSATLAGHVKIEDHVVIGGLSAVHQFVRIGKHVMIGGVSGVGRDVGPFTMYIGSRDGGITGLNTVGLKRSGFSEQAINEIRQAYKILFDTSSGRTLSLGMQEVQERFSGNKSVEYILDFLNAKSRRGICRFYNEEI
jgi:UDP-N-acetylglucosamine acyltransferase